MLSYWEQQSFLSYDHIIIGAGIVGLSTAIELKERFPEARVLVLERGLLPTGASSRNAGFACMGSATELLEDLETNDEASVIDLFFQRKRGLERLRQRLSDAKIGYTAEGSYELIHPTDEAILEKLDYLNGLLEPLLHQPAFTPANDKIETFGFVKDQVKALIQNTCEGAIHTGKMLRALTDYAIHSGIEIKTGAEVFRFEEEGNGVTVIIKDPFRQEDLLLHTKTLCICTNAFTRQLLPEQDIKPGRGQVIITHPIPGLKFKGIFHMERGYYYFREIDGRVLFGGGRNLDFEGEETTEFGLSNKIQLELERRLHEIILPGMHYGIAQRWSGIMAFGNTKSPVVQQFSPHVFGAFRMGGMGVALGSEVAVRVADLIGDYLNQN